MPATTAYFVFPVHARVSLAVTYIDSAHRGCIGCSGVSVVADDCGSDLVAPCLAEKWLFFLCNPAAFVAVTRGGEPKQREHGLPHEKLHILYAGNRMDNARTIDSYHPARESGE